MSEMGCPEDMRILYNFNISFYLFIYLFIFLMGQGSHIIAVLGRRSLCPTVSLSGGLCPIAGLG